MRTKTTKATSKAPTTPVRRCPECGIGVSPGPFQLKTPSSSEWHRCADCAAGGPDAIRAAMLARVGIEYPSGHPAVLAALRNVSWRARPLAEAAARAQAEQRTPRLPSLGQHDKWEGRVARTLASIDSVGRPSATPWEHVDARQVRRAVEEAIVSAPLAPALLRCTGGPCGICGVQAATSWPVSVRIGARSGLDASRRYPWPVCGTCAPLLEQAGQIPTSEAARRRWTATVLGVETSPPPLSVPPLVATYAEYVEPGTDPRTAEGCSTPWEFVSDADREQLAQAAPQHRPREVLDRERRAAAAVARLDRQRRQSAPRSALATGSDQ